MLNAAIKQHVLLLICIFFSFTVFSQNHAVINADLGISKINKPILGHIAEDL